MLIKIGIENNFENRFLAWTLDYPGCFAYGSNETEALIRIPQALVAFKSWLEGFTADSWLRDLADFDIRLVETFQTHCLNDQYEPAPEGMSVGAWFHHDWLPLTGLEIEQALSVLRWAHQDLYELAASLSEAQLDQEHPGERWNIRGILRHVASSEWWYLDRLSLTRTRRDELPDEVWKRLEFTLEQTLKAFPPLAGKEDVRGRQGELWSPRKILRRACWHALDHCQHIHKLITGQ